MPGPPAHEIVISSRGFLFGCLLTALGVGILTWRNPLLPVVLAAEIAAVILGLFVFGSTRYVLHKNALTYGGLLVMVATFFPLWWPRSVFYALWHDRNGEALWQGLAPHLLTLTGWERLLHADTMLFILGLTLFVNVIAKTELLETLSFWNLRRLRGRLFAVVLSLVMGVAVASGVLDGVSMVGFMIRILVILLTAAGLAQERLIFIVLTSVVVTTVCGMWLAYGEPPNLIMKSNLELSDMFFLKNTLPLAVISLVVVLWGIRQRLLGILISETTIQRLFEKLSPSIKAQRCGLLSFIPFILLLFWHSQNHEIPLFVSSFAGFACAWMGLSAQARRIALHEATEEYREYLFLFPLFLSITMLSAVHFFDPIKTMLEHSSIGVSHLAAIQFLASGLLSAMLDNNVVADFASRAIEGLPQMPLYAAAQIAGYATGGCLTHIGSAQSVVAFAYIRKHIAKNFTPWDWIKAVWALIAAISVALVAAIYLLAALY